MYDETKLKCKECDEVIPIYNDVVIFLPHNDWKGFFGKNYNFENYTLDEDKNFFKKIASQNDYLEVIRMIDRYTDTENSKKSFIDSIQSRDINDPVQEKAVLEADDLTIEKGRVEEKNLILDWPTGPGTCIRKLVNNISKDSLIVSSEINLLAIFRLKKYLESKDLTGNIIFVNNDVTKMPFRDNIFDLVTVFGLTVEVPNPDLALSETNRVMKKKSLLVGNGEMYNENSESVKIANEMNIGQLATQSRLLGKMRKLGFTNIDIEEHYSGHDTDTLPDKERCPLPAKKDWFAYVVVKAEKE